MIDEDDHYHDVECHDENGNDGDDHDKAGGLLMVIIVIQEEAGW